MENRTDVEDAGGTFQRATGLLVNDLLDCGRLRIVEREKQDAVPEELQLGSSGLVDEAQAEKIDALLGPDVLLFSTLESVETDEKTRSAVIAENSRRRVGISLTARLVHVGTCEILASAEALNDAVPALADELASRIPRKAE